jgi:hypothetical protein
VGDERQQERGKMPHAPIFPRSLALPAMSQRGSSVDEAILKKLLTWAVFGSFVASSVGACSSGDSGTPAGAGAAQSGAGAQGIAGSPVNSGAGAGVNPGAGAGNSSAGSSSGGAGNVAGASTGGANSAGSNTGGASTAGASNGGAHNSAGATGSAGAGSAGAPSTDLIAGLLALAKQPCANVVSAHTYALDDGSKVPICATTGAGTTGGAVFWTSDMDVDCDGKSTTECNVNTDCCYQDDTAFHNKSDQPLTASVTPYVVIPQDFKFTGLNAGTLIAVIYNNQVTWAVWGDTGPTDIIGEASYATAKSLGINPDAKTGGIGGKVVTYIAFLGKQAVPKDIEDRTEANKLGPQLAQALLSK